MKTSIFSFLLPPKLPDYEQNQKAGLLHVMLIASFVAALLIGFDNYSHGWTQEAIALFLLSAACIGGIYLNHSSNFKSAALIFCISLPITLYFLLFHGINLYDESILGYPLFMLCTAFLFGKRGLILATICSIGSIVIIYILAVERISQSSFHPTPNRLLLLCLLYLVMASIGWFVQETWQTNLFNLRESYDLTLGGWNKALEYRDGETAGHTRRVTELCLELARKVGCSEEELVQIRRGAYLHDIGKIAIPDSILLKPGPLSEQEWVTMKQHPDFAVKMVSDIPYLQNAISIPQSHHENWDGSGYPQGLKGNEIPLAARIFSVVDHWDALNSDRPYRKAWPREKVVSYIRENEGKIFDPEIVEPFLDIVLKDEKRI